MTKTVCEVQTLHGFDMRSAAEKQAANNEAEEVNKGNVLVESVGETICLETFTSHVVARLQRRTNALVFELQMNQVGIEAYLAW